MEMTMEIKIKMKKLFKISYDYIVYLMKNMNE